MTPAEKPNTESSLTHYCILHTIFTVNSNEVYFHFIIRVCARDMAKSQSLDPARWEWILRLNLSLWKVWFRFWIWAVFLLQGAVSKDNRWQVSASRRCQQAGCANFFPCWERHMQKSWLKRGLTCSVVARTEGWLFHRNRNSDSLYSRILVLSKHV